MDGGFTPLTVTAVGGVVTPAPDGVEEPQPSQEEKALGPQDNPEPSITKEGTPLPLTSIATPLTGHESCIATVREVLDNAIARRAIPGAVVGIVEADSSTYTISAGRETYDPESPFVDEQTIYDVASITKLIPTAILAMKLVEEDEMDLDVPISYYIPLYRGGYRNEITVRHLLAHAVDWGFSLSSLKDHKADEILHAIFNAQPRRTPGSSIAYSNISSILLGLIIERAYGSTLAQAAELSLFSPLRMDSSTFDPLSIHLLENIAPSEIDDWRAGEVRGYVHDESAYVLSRAGLSVGSAGLFSSVSDLLKIAEMLVQGGIYSHQRIMKHETIEMMCRVAFKDVSGLPNGMGGSVGSSDIVGPDAPAGLFYKTGFTGCLFAFDPAAKRVLIVLSNHTYPHRQVDKMVRNDLFRRIVSAVFGKKES